MSADGKDNSLGTIVHLVKAEDTEKPVDKEFFRAQPSGTQNDSTQFVPERVNIQSRLKQAEMLIVGGRLGPELSDEYRRIKRPLLSNAFGKSASLVDHGNLILVTSSVTGEGKTTTSVNLAMSIAQERDHTVLLVDCDVDKQGVSRMLGVSSMPGLIDVLKDDYFTVGDALLRTDVPELSVLAAGKQHEYVTELLASQRMSNLVEEMSSRYDDRVIIFDAPPLLPTPQTQVLASLVGQIVFVIEAGQTPQSAVEEALDMIRGDKPIGLVLNKSVGTFGRSGYYYGYYGSDDDKKK
jgi:exopolysaccharide/PEP-CTERM locus tyrosine autokinase